MVHGKYLGLNGLQKMYLRLINSGNLFLEHLTFENTVKSRIWNAIYLISSIISAQYQQKRWEMLILEKNLIFLVKRKMHKKYFKIEFSIYKNKYLVTIQAFLRWETEIQTDYCMTITHRGSSAQNEDIPLLMYYYFSNDSFPLGKYNFILCARHDFGSYQLFCCVLRDYCGYYIMTE